MGGPEISHQYQPSVDAEKRFDSFEAAAEQLKTDFQDMFADIPIYKEMEESRLEFALGDNEDFMAKIYPEDNNEFYQDIKGAMIKFRSTLDQLHDENGFSYQSIFEAKKKVEGGVLYISPRFITDEMTGDKVHVGMFIADDRQVVITYHTEPKEDIKQETKKIIDSGLI